LSSTSPSRSENGLATGALETFASPRTTPFRFWAVVLSTAGVFVAISAVRLARNVPTTDMLQTFDLLQLLAIEAAMGAFWIPRLVRDGWTLSFVTLPFAARDLLRGALLCLVSQLTYVTTWVAVALLFPDFVREAARIRIGGHPSWWSVGLVAVFNPVAEEFLYLGFVANSLRRRSTALALGASVLVRVGVHAYQGPLALLAILPAGLVLTTYYLDTNRIWPVVVAHSAVDLYALGRLAGSSL